MEKSKARNTENRVPDSKTIEANMFEFSVPQHVLDKVVEEYLGNELDNELEEVQCLLQDINNPSQETQDDTE